MNVVHEAEMAAPRCPACCSTYGYLYSEGLPRRIAFLGSSLRDLEAFPKSAKRKIGFQLDRLENDLEPSDWKPMTGIGPGVYEVRVRDETGAYRVIYLASMETAIYVLHCFKKTTRKTSARDIDLATRRCRMLLSEMDK